MDRETRLNAKQPNRSFGASRIFLRDEVVRTSISERRAFSMIELVIVLVIIGILGSIAAMRASSGGSNASEVAVEASIVTLQKALEHYAVEHLGNYPGVSTMRAQLTHFSDAQGNTSLTKGGQFVFGPYMRKMPKNLLVFNTTGDEDSDTAEGDNVVDLEFNVSTGELTVIELRGNLNTRSVGQRLVDADLADDLASLGLN